MKSYVLNFQLAFKLERGYNVQLMQGAVFADPEERLVAVMDSNFRKQQKEGFYTRRHNVLTLQHLRKLYLSPSLSKRTPMGFLPQIVL